MQEEFWDLFDETRRPVGKTHRRGDRIPVGLYHLVVHAWIAAPSGKLLFSRRQAGRTDAGKWERTGGSALAGETSLEAAMRETHEELGISLSGARIFFFGSRKREQYHDFYDSWVFLLPEERVPSPDPVEVAEAAWMSADELDALAKDDRIVASSLYYRDILDFIARSRTE